MQEETFSTDETAAQRIQRLTNKIWDDEEEKKLANRRIMKEGAMAAMALRMKRPDLISQGPNPTLNWYGLSDPWKAAYAYWWGEYTSVKAAAEDFGVGQHRVRSRVQKLSEESGQTWDKMETRAGRRKVEQANE